MRISPIIHNGDVVEIRRERWRVVDIQSFDRCRLLTLSGTGTSNRGCQRRFLLPFETVALLDRRRALRSVGIQRWRRACRALLADCVPPGGLRSPRSAHIDLLPHQLEPALAVVSGRGTRVLLADEVGLGKTIQAGLILAELRARGIAERVLIATPAGLRDQWRTELRNRFAIDAAIVDLRELRRRAASLPIGLNPWVTCPCAITSVDYLKRPEVLQAVQSCRWDVLVVDEAHGVGYHSDRHSAIGMLAARASYVLLLTATPHNGDARAFASLCGLGAQQDRLLVFRRTKASVHLGTRRHIHQLQVRPTAAEARMHARLADFAAAVRSEHDTADAWLALSVLHKRAFSSARSLELTVARRLERLAPNAADDLQQLALPLTDSHGELDTADEPPDCLAGLALADERRERRLLRALLDAARTAAASETKIAAIRRLLDRIAEPVIVFTEFRDTLYHLRAGIAAPVAMLHGGLSRDERSTALDHFISGARRILLATDAAGEGLNLHQRCRTVINLELPWNPMRLEQRIGRVDRIGQRQVVHVFHLVGRSTGETRVLARLKARLARARTDLPAANPIEDEERATARFVIDGRSDEAPAEIIREPAHDGAGGRMTIDLAADAQREASRTEWTRTLANADDAKALALLDATWPWIARTRARRTRFRLGRRAIAILRIDHEDGRGRLCGFSLVAMMFAVARRARGRLRDLHAVPEAAWAAMQSRAAETGRLSHVERSRLNAEFLSTLATRHRRIGAALFPDPSRPWQTGLFDRRAERAYAASRAAIDDTAFDLRSRLEGASLGSILTERPAHLLLVLVP